MALNKAGFAEKCQKMIHDIHKPTTPLAHSDISAFVSKTARLNAGSFAEISSRQ